MEFPSVYQSENPLVIKKYYYRRVYSVSKSVGNNIFLLPTDFPTEKNYQWKIHRQSISVGDFVGKLITNGICVLRRRKNSVGKNIKCCCECHVNDDKEATYVMLASLSPELQM